MKDERKKEVAQDSDIEDKPGTQPKKYYAGLKKSTKEKRAAHFKRGAKMDDDNPDAYTPAPGDADAKTKPSKHTLKYKRMYGEEIEGLKKKAEKSGISYSILKKVYDRGVAAWRTGHRPGTTPQQWGMARVNSFVTKGKGTWGKADKDLASKVQKEEFINEDWFTKLINKKVTHKKDYENAKDILKQVLNRKRKENNGKLPHTPEYYAQRIANQFTGIDARELASMVTEESKEIEGLKKKAEKSGISYSILKRMYDRGGMAMVNSEIEFEEFKKHWKNKPSQYKYNLSRIEELNRYYRDYFKHIESKYGPIPEKIKKAISTSSFKSNPTVTYKGKKFVLRTGMDECELLYHVYESDRLNEQKTDKESKGNPVAKYMNKYNKPSVQKDKKKEQKKGYTKHKARVQEMKSFKEYVATKSDVTEFYDVPMDDNGPMEEKEMMMRQLHFIAYAAEEIMEYVEMIDDPKEWFQNKLSNVFDKIRGLHSYVEGDKRLYAYTMGEENINEVLKASDSIDVWIKDFLQSDNKRFEGKSREERINMAKGAYYAAQKNEELVIESNKKIKAELKKLKNDDAEMAAFLLDQNDEKELQDFLKTADSKVKNIFKKNS